MANKSKEGKKRINHPAGINDKIDVVGTDINIIIEKGEPELKTSKKGVERPEQISIHLDEGSSIKTYDNILSFEELKARIEAKNSGKVTDINEYKRSKKQKDEGRDIG